MASALRTRCRCALKHGTRHIRACSCDSAENIRLGNSLKGAISPKWASAYRGPPAETGGGSSCSAPGGGGGSFFTGGAFACDAPSLAQPGQVTGLLSDADLLTVRYLRIFSKRFLPMPRIDSRSSTLLNAP